MLDDKALDVLFREAHTHHGWKDRPVDDALLTSLHDLLRMGPTAANAQPLRLVFVKSQAAKERLKPALAPGNVDKTMAAPVTAVLAYDTRFYEKLPRLYPAWPGADKVFGALPADARDRTALLSAALQAGYLIMAARAMGLDCGPMGGFETAEVDKAFFADGQYKSFLLVNLGYGDKTYPRNDRLGFAEVAQIA